MPDRKKLVIISVVFSIIILSLIIFVIYPLRKNIQKNSKELISARENLAIYKVRTGNSEQSQDIYRQIEPNLKKIEKLFVDQEIPIELIRFWEKIANNSDVSINISPVSLSKTEDDPWEVIGFKITVIGSFSNFLRFLEKVEIGPFLIEIQNFQVKKSISRIPGIENSFENISASLVIKSFAK